MTLFNLNHYYKKGPVSTYSHSLRYWGIRVSTYEFWENQVRLHLRGSCPTSSRSCALKQSVDQLLLCAWHCAKHWASEGKEDLGPRSRGETPWKERKTREGGVSKTCLTGVTRRGGWMRACPGAFLELSKPEAG